MNAVRDFCPKPRAKARAHIAAMDSLHLIILTWKTPINPHTHTHTHTHTQHLLRKLQQRDPDHHARIQELLAAAACDASALPVHPCFSVLPGPVAEWERVKEEAGREAVTKGKEGKGGKGCKRKGDEAAATVTITTTDMVVMEAEPAGVKRTTRSSARTITIAGSSSGSIGGGSGEEVRGGGLQASKAYEQDEAEGVSPAGEASAASVAAAGRKRQRQGVTDRSNITITTITSTSRSSVTVTQPEPQPPQQRRSGRIRKIEIK
jgi:hypothetical protein